MTKLIRLIRVMSKPTLAVVQLFVIIVLVWNILRFYPGDRWLLVRLGNYVVPWLFVGLIPVLVVALWGRHRWFIGTSVIALLLMAGRYSYLLTLPTQPVNAKTNAGQLKVMTFNVHYSNRSSEIITNLIRTEKLDIIALQEVTDEFANSLLPELASEYPYSLVETSSDRRAPELLISRYPLERQPKPLATNRSQRAIITTPDGQVMVWNLHAKPAIKPGGWEMQTESLTSIAATLTETNGPTIILGDFNVTNQAENYDLIADHLTEVHQAVGRGFGFTYPETDVLDMVPGSPWYVQILHLAQPVFRIDHIFVSGHFVPLETHVIPDGFGSDHRPVVATLQFVPK